MFLSVPNANMSNIFHFNHILISGCNDVPIITGRNCFAFILTIPIKIIGYLKSRIYKDFSIPVKYFNTTFCRIIQTPYDPSIIFPVSIGRYEIGNKQNTECFAYRIASAFPYKHGVFFARDKVVKSWISLPENTVQREFQSSTVT